MLIGDAKKSVHALGAAARVFVPRNLVQEDAHRVHADGLRPPQLGVDYHRVERIGVPHLNLIDGAGGNVIGADVPGLLGIPEVGGFGGPLDRFDGKGGEGQKQTERDAERLHAIEHDFNNDREEELRGCYKRSQPPVLRSPNQEVKHGEIRYTPRPYCATRRARGWTWTWPYPPAHHFVFNYENVLGSPASPSGWRIKG